MNDVNRQAAARRRSGLSAGLIGGLASILTALLISAAEADAVFPEGSSWGIEAPDGFAPAAEFSGFTDPQSGGAIVIVELPIPVEHSAAMVDGLATSDRWMAEGITIESRSRFNNGDLNGWLLIGTRQDGPTEFRIGVLIVGGEAGVGQIIAQVPIRPGGETKFQQMLAALDTVAAGAPATPEEQVAALPFALTDLAGMRIDMTMIGTAVGLTLGPDSTSDATKQPQLVIAFGPLPQPIAESDHLAVSRAEFDGKHPGAVIEGETRIVSAGRPGAEIVARWQPPDAEGELLVGQWTVFDGQHVFLAVGKTVPARRESDMDMFVRVVDGLKRK
jgi:hypothetical protein